MADTERGVRLQPALLDRLTDLKPDSKVETLDKQVMTMAELRSAVLRDLNWLFNTTNLDTVDTIPPDSLIATSCINFGVPGLTGTDALDRRSMMLERMMTDAIRAYEPRILPGTLKVRIRPYEREGGLPTLTLEITAELWAQPVPQQLFLETAIELETRIASVTETKGRI